MYAAFYSISYATYTFYVLSKVVLMYAYLKCVDKKLKLNNVMNFQMNESYIKLILTILNRKKEGKWNKKFCKIY